MIDYNYSGEGTPTPRSVAMSIKNQLAEHASPVALAWQIVTRCDGDYSNEALNKALNELTSPAEELESDADAIVADPDMSINDKVRALKTAGWGNTKIAKALGKSYQRVKNVVKKMDL